MELVADEVISIHTNGNNYQYHQIYPKRTYIKINTKRDTLPESVELTNERTSR